LLTRNIKGVWRFIDKLMLMVLELLSSVGTEAILVNNHRINFNIICPGYRAASLAAVLYANDLAKC
jgi:hypothetical protein